MRQQHIRLPSIPLALAIAMLTFTATSFGVNGPGFFGQPAHAGSASSDEAGASSADQSGKSGASASASANASAETKTGDEKMSKSNCRSSASSHAKATASDGEQTITREDHDYDEGDGCTAQSSAKATSRSGGAKTEQD